MIAAAAAWLRRESGLLRAETRTALPGDAGLQLATMIAVFVAMAFALASVWFVAGGMLSQAASIAILLGAAACGIASGALYGRRTWARSAVLCVGGYALTAVAAQRMVDVSYDGQDYHFTAIWALVNGWNPYHNLFSSFVAPGSDEEMWAWHFPKAHWLYNALQVSAGLGYEAAKTETVLLAAASFGAVQGAARRFGMAMLPSAMLATLAMLNPIAIQELFTRMNDGVMAGFVVLFAVFGAVWVVRGERRAALATFVVLAVALNTKQSAILILGVLCAWLCATTLVRQGWRAAAGRAALLLGGALAALFVLGADPYLSNWVKKGNPVYPMRGAPTIVIDDEFRPPALMHHSDPVRLAMSLAARTSYRGPTYKLPFAVDRDEIVQAGDAEVFLAGFGPWFSGVMLIGVAAASLVAAKRPPLRSLPAGLAIAAVVLAASAFAMPENWAVRYVPQLWLVPLLFVAAAARWRAGRWLAIGCGVAMLGDAAMVAGSLAQRQGGASATIARQIARLGLPGAPLSADIGASPARLALLEQRGLRVALRAGPDRRCAGTEPLPLAYAYEDDGARPATICRLAR